MNSALSSPDFNQLPMQPMNNEALNFTPNPEINSINFMAKIGNIAINGYQMSPLKSEVNNAKAPLNSPQENKLAAPLPENMPLNTIDTQAIQANLAQMRAYKAGLAAQAERQYNSIKLPPIHESALALSAFARRSARRRGKNGKNKADLPNFRLAA